jgi:hypothetical protein
MLCIEDWWPLNKAHNPTTFLKKVPRGLLKRGMGFNPHILLVPPWGALYGLKPIHHTLLKKVGFK